MLLGQLFAFIGTSPDQAVCIFAFFLQLKISVLKVFKTSFFLFFSALVSVGVEQQLSVSCTDALETRKHPQTSTRSHEGVAHCCCKSGWGHASCGACHYGAAGGSKV